MRDWSEVVRARLAPLGLDAERETQIRAELAGHLEDSCEDAVRRGCTEEDAVARALATVPDWIQLADVIRLADKEGNPMTRDARTLLFPGMGTLCCASAVLLGLRFVPPALWTDQRLSVLIPGVVLLAYLVFGALGASWSRRAGGSIAARFVAGVFPLALHVFMFAIVVVAAQFENSRISELVQLNMQLRVALRFIVFPGLALAIGALPFLRDKTETRVSA